MAKTSPPAAAASLADRVELADRIGAGPLAAQARAELRAAGARPRGARRTGLDGLMPSEHRVAAMAAAGRSNPEIAQALSVSRKTIEMHLGHAYRKLGIASRHDLARALAPPADRPASVPPPG